MKKREDGKLTGKNEEKILQNELSKPTYYLIGWNHERGAWCAVRKGLVSFRSGTRVIEEGRPRYTRIMMVSQVEFRALGMPAKESAEEYFTVEGQRRVSDHYGQNKASKAKKAV